MFAVGLIALQMLAQSSGPQSWLIPGNRTSHVQTISILAALLVVLVAVASFAAGTRGIAVPAFALATNAVCWLFCTEMWVTSVRYMRKPSNKVIKVARIAAGIAAMAALISPLAASRFGPEADWFLTGEQPVLAALIAGVGATLLVFCIWQLSSAQRVWAEESIPPAVTVTEVIQIQQYKQQVAPSTKAAPGERVRHAWARQLAAVTIASEYAKTSFDQNWTTMRLWLLGNQAFSLQRLGVAVLAVLSYMFLGPILLSAVFPDESTVITHPALIQMVPVSMIVCVVGLQTWHRFAMFGCENLRAVSRTTWVNETLTSHWIVLTVLLGIHWLFATGFHLYQGKPFSGLWFLTEVVALVGYSTFAAAVIAWLVTQRRPLATAAGVIGIILPTTAMVTLHWHKAPPHDMPVFFSQPAAMGIGAACLLAIGIATMRATRRHWMKMELIHD